MSYSKKASSTEISAFLVTLSTYPVSYTHLDVYKRQVPMYDAVGYLDKDLLEITAQDFLKVVRAHAEEGVDFMTIHAGINKRAVESFRRAGRKMNIVSRGGSLLFAWMEMTGNENPFFEYYDEVLDILNEYDVTISLGDALRPGCIADSTDRCV